MITSDRQLKVTLGKIEDLTKSLTAKNSISNTVLQKAAKIEATALIEDLTAQVKEYDELRTIGLEAIKISDPEDFMLLPIRYRIAKHMTQEVFAQSVEVSVRMIARYESEEYRNITGETLKKILHKIPLKFKGNLREA
ncbi:MAG TPA: helix-turn-helix transcriptional regulator [Bacteriovoracaceae bacterium]|nr:helix-turn-helix transcriptional regulator [Bacteriovoracaceae bacterium]